MTVIVDPDCTAGKHSNCDGTGWDTEADRTAPCPCTCHEMRVLTVRQPWAWAIVHGGKDVENRVRNVAGAYRGPVAIHVAKQDDEGWEENDASAFLPRPGALGWSWPTYAPPYWSDYGTIIGVVDLTDAHDRFCDTDDHPICSEWAEFDRWHLVLTNPLPLKTPIPFTGALGLRRLDPTTIARIQEQL